MSTTKKLVAWGKAETDRFGDVAGYRSKCGRFYVQRRDICMPYAGVAYNIFYVEGGQLKCTEHDRLSDAKGDAEDMAAEGSGYNLSALPEGFKGK